MTSFLPRLVGVGSVKLIRSFHRSSKLNASSYDGDGKMTVTILNKDHEYGLMIDAVETSGFKLNNGLWIVGPMIIFPKTVLGWNLRCTEEITEESLALFSILDPQVDIFIMGLDQTYDNSAPFIKILRDFTKKQRMKLEILPTIHAVSTFNFLNAENRYVAAALLPPRRPLPAGLRAMQEAIVRRNLSKSDEQNTQIESK